MQEPLPASAQIVQQKLSELQHSGRVVMLSDSARTAQQAADGLGVTVGQIVKSLIFAMQTSQTGVLILVSGSNRVSESAIEAILGEPIGKANADQVREWTGFAIGGVPPVAHRQHLRTLIDQDLLQYDQIWAAAGHHHAVFPLTPAELVSMTGGEIVDVVHSKH